MSKLFVFTVLALSALMISGCGRDRVAGKMPAGMSAFVYAYTSGTVSKATPVRVRFTRTAVGQDQIGKPVAAGLFDLVPSTEGQCIWEDDHTIRFEPAAALPSNTTYLGRVHLDDIFKEAKGDLATFEFDFHTREQFLTVGIEGMNAPNQADMTQQELLGMLTTSDAADDEAVQKMLTVSQNNENITLVWSHEPDRMHHHFTVRGVRRGAAASTVKVAWNGSAIGANQVGEQIVDIPSLSDFVMMGARIHSGEEKLIELYFSDPLDPNQQLEGLVSLTGGYYGSLRFLTEGNIMRVYPSYDVTGEAYINVNQAVKNFAGKPLGKDVSRQLSFGDTKPAVRLVGRGVIMPASEGLIFPFEAINLNFVDVEIFKIYDNNVLQFLQTNDLDNSNEMNRVGRVVFQKQVSLKELNTIKSTRDWTRFALDLNKFIKADMDAIYQVRIGFKKQYSNYSCVGDPSKQEAGMATLEEKDESEDMESIMDWNYNHGDEEEHSYRHRDDPCFSAYYTPERFVSRNVIASDLGMIAKKGANNTLSVIVTDLKTTDIRQGVKIDFYDFQQQLLGTANTSGQGIATATLPRKPYVAVATWQNQHGYLLLGDGKELQMSRFEIAGTAPQKGFKGYLYGERGVWRPGDSLFLDFVLEDKTNKLPPNHPVTLELYDPRGQLQQRVTSSTNVRNIYPFHLATSPEAPTGTWRADIKTGGASFSENLRIETVKPNRLKIKADFGKKTLTSTDKDLRANVDIAWLHGAPGRNLKAKIEMQLVRSTTAFANFKTFVFDDAGASFNTEPQVVFDGATDANGHGNLAATITAGKGAPGKLTANFRARAYEAGGDFSSDFFSMDFSPYASYAGVSLPTTKQGEKRIDIGTNSTFTVASVTEDGKPIKGQNLMVTVYRVDWRWWWEIDEDGEGDYAQSTNMTPITNETVKTDGKGQAFVKTKVTQWGRYYVRVNDAVSGHSTGDFFYAGYPWNDENNQDQSRDAAAMLAFSSDKTKYSVGDQVKLNIPTGQAGRVLVSLENGTGVIETYWMKAKAGENTFSFRTTPAMSPTVYANVTLIQPHAQVQNDLPIRLYGVIPIAVEDPKTRLSPVIDMANEVQPDQDFNITVSEKTGHGMAYTIALVDDGLLDLTRFQTPNPWDAFYAKEALGVATYDLFDQVLGAYGGKMERLLSVGGDKSGKSKNAVKANRFKPTVQHLGPFYIAAGKKATHKLRIPDYIGSVRAMVVAADKGAYGSAEKTVLVRKPLMVLATLPRVLGPGERFTVPIDVFALDGKVKNATVTVKEANGFFNFGGSTTRNISFSQPGDQMVNFGMTVANKTGVAKFKVTATGNGITATQDIEIQIRNPNPVITNVTQAFVENGKTWNGTFMPPSADGTGTAMLEVSTMPPLNLARRLQYLIQYPHGCIEQTTSAVFPQLYVGKLMEISPALQKSITANINSGITHLKGFQTSAGGFSYWPGENAVSQWGTNYAGHFMLEAQTAGYALPSGMLDRWKSFQQKVAKRWDPALDNSEGFGVADAELSQAYRLYTLALARAPETGAMNQLRERKGLCSAAKWRLAAAYTAAGKPEVAKQLIAGVATTVPKYRELAYTYGSETRDQAMIAEALYAIGDKAKAMQVLTLLSQNMSNDDWYSTQDIAYTLLAAAKIAGGQVATGINIAYTADNNSERTATSKSHILQLPINGNNGKLNLRNLGKGALYVRIITTGQPAVGQEKSAASNLNMVINYKTLKGEKLNPTRIKQGTDFIAEVIVTNPGTLGQHYREMALSQIFPSGWEILNPRMDKMQGYTNTSIPEYQDLRDDRVYTYFDLAPNTQHTYRIQLNAAYAGRYYLPATLCEAMYNNNISARQQGQWVEIVQEGADAASL